MALHNIPEHSEQWHAMRLMHIGGSEIASLFGVETDEDVEGDSDIPAKFADSLFSLHYIKSGVVKRREVDHDRVDAGTLLEPFIADFAARKRGWKIVKGEYATDETTKGMGASLDYVVVDAGADANGVVPDGRTVLRGISAQAMRGQGVLQIKNVALSQYYAKWVDNEPPLYVVLQVQHEMACAGLLWGVLAAWVGGNSLKLFFYEARLAAIAMIRRRVADFWQRVRDGTPPAADGSDASAWALRELYPALRDNETAPLDLRENNEIPELCAKLTATTELRLKAQKDEDRYKARIAQIMGDASYAFTDTWTIKCSVTPANHGRTPLPGELIGVRKESRRYYVKEKADGGTQAKARTRKVGS